MVVGRSCWLLTDRAALFERRATNDAQAPPARDGPPADPDPDQHPRPRTATAPILLIPPPHVVPSSRRARDRPSAGRPVDGRRPALDRYAALRQLDQLSPAQPSSTDPRLIRLASRRSTEHDLAHKAPVVQAQLRVQLAHTRRRILELQQALAPASSSSGGGEGRVQAIQSLISVESLLPPPLSPASPRS